MFRRLAFVLFWATASCGDSAICDPAELTSALAGTVPGDIVEIGNCTIAGSFTVPAGVTLRGTSRTDSKLISLDRNPVLELQPGTPGPRVESLSIESAARFGIRSDGLGTLVLHDLEVRATSGAAIAIKGADLVELSAVHLESQAISANSSGGVATHGLVLVSIQQTSLDDVSINGFGEVGALFVLSEVTWNSGNADANRAAGVIVEGGSAAFTDLSISRTITKLSPMRSWAGVFHAGATVNTNALSLQDNEAYGVLHKNTAEVTHLATSGNNNQNGALWMSEVPNITIDAGSFDQNQFAAIIAHRTSNLTLSNTTISNTRSVSRILEIEGNITIGDGLQLKESTTAIDIDQLTLRNNEHAGMLIDLGGAGTTAAIDISQTLIEVASAAAFGAVAQNGAVLPGWDANINRSNYDPARDLTSGLPAVGAVGPCEFPAPTGLDQRPLDSLVPP